MASTAAAGGVQNNNDDQRRNKKMLTAITSPVSLATLAIISKRPRTRIHPGKISYFHDLHCPSHSWLLPGWIAEERFMERGRVYMYYYDPEGKQFSIRQEVIAAWEKIGLIVVDK